MDKQQCGERVMTKHRASWFKRMRTFLLKNALENFLWATATLIFEAGFLHVIVFINF